MQKIPEEIKKLINQLHALIEKRYPDLEVTIQIKIRSSNEKTERSKKDISY